MPGLNKARTARAWLKTSLPVFAALGEETRLRLVVVLCASGPRSIAQLTAETDVSRQAVTKHLDVLADAGLVHDLWQGREHLWQLEPRRLGEARDYLEQISSQWQQALSHPDLAAERN
jgi:DNA-binding transcriptional ArsR family regulator